jgi:hypothetical protein
VGKGNLYGRVTSVSAEEDKDAQPAEGARALKFGYNPSLNKIVKIIPLSLDPKKPPMSGDWFPQPWHYNSGDANFMGEECVTNLMGAKKDISLPVGKSYTISFKVKGRNFTNGHWLVAEHGYGLRSPKKITRGERGSANVQADAAIEVASDAGTLNPGTSWSTVTKTLDLHFKHCPELNLQPDEWGKKFKGMSAPTYHAFIYFCAEVRPPDGAVYIDDVSITEKTQ